MQLQCDVPMGMVPHRSKPCRLQSFEHASHHIDICEHGEAELQSASMCPWALVWAALGEPCRLSMPASLWDVCARGGATVCDVPMGWLRACRMWSSFPRHLAKWV